MEYISYAEKKPLSSWMLQLSNFWFLYCIIEMMKFSSWRCNSKGFSLFAFIYFVKYHIIIVCEQMITRCYNCSLLPDNHNHVDTWHHQYTHLYQYKMCQWSPAWALEDRCTWNCLKCWYSSLVVDMFLSVPNTHLYLIKTKQIVNKILSGKPQEKYL